MSGQTFLQGFQRVLNSHQIQTAAGSLTAAWVAIHYAAAALPPVEQSALWIAFIGAVFGIMREVLNSFAEEDVAKIQTSATTLQTQIQQAAPLTHQAYLSPPTSQTDPVQRSMKAIIPPVVLLVIGLFLTGCTASNPELSTYREGAWAVQKPLNDAHLQLMSDAVKAGIRDTNDQLVIQRGIQEATALYQQSKTTESAGALVPTAPVVVPTTQP